MVDALTPIPQPSEIVAFLIRAMSHIGDEQELALKKELQRLRKGKPLSPSAANAMLKKHLGEFHAANGNTEWEATDFLPMLKGYTQLCLHLDCSALPTDVIRSVFDRVAYGCFLELFKSLLPITGVTPNELRGKPDQATKLLWQSRIKDLGLKRIATEIDSIPGLHKGQENWEASLDRWSKGQHDVQITTIFALMKNWDRKFARTLLAARLYKRYCELEMVDHRKHRPGYELPFDYSEIQTAIQKLTQSQEYSSTCCLDKRCEDAIYELNRLTNPHRPKDAEDATNALELIQMLETSLKGQPRLAGLGFFRGLYHAQMAQLPEALEAFDSAADWFQFRGARQLKNCLHHALNISHKLGKKRIFSKWEGWCEGLGLDIEIPDANIAFARDFQNPFLEATAFDHRQPLEKYIIDISTWENRRVDLRHPNREIKGYGATPTPQLCLFANLGQAEKVQHLLDAGADPDLLDKNGGSALLSALQGGDDACVSALLSVTSKKAINSKTKGGKTPLHQAIALGRSDFVRELIERGADVEIRGSHQQTALFGAIGHFTHPDAMALSVLRHGYSSEHIPAFLRKTSSPFIGDKTAAQSLANYLESKLAVLPELSKKLTHGDRSDMRSIVQLLLDAGADINAPVGTANLTPFLYAATVGNPWLLETLVEHGADIRSKDAQGRTALIRLHHFDHSNLASDFLSWLEPADRIWLREN